MFCFMWNIWSFRSHSVNIFMFSPVSRRTSCFWYYPAIPVELCHRSHRVELHPTPLFCCKAEWLQLSPACDWRPGSSRKMIAIGISIVGPLELTVAMVSRETYMTFGQQKSGPPYNFAFLIYFLRANSRPRDMWNSLWFSQNLVLVLYSVGYSDCGLSSLQEIDLLLDRSVESWSRAKQAQRVRWVATAPPGQNSYRTGWACIASVHTWSIISQIRRTIYKIGWHSLQIDLLYRQRST